MIVYMLKNDTGGYYKASHGKGYGGHWVDQGAATVWTSIQGPASAKGQYLKRWRRRNAGQDDPELTVETFQLIPQQIRLFRGDDWQGLYANGKLVRETHSFDGLEVLEELGAHCYDESVNEEKLEAAGGFPKTQAEVEAWST